MLPHKHFVISGFVALIGGIFFYSELGMPGLALWVVIGGVVSALIDIDALILIFLNDTLKEFRNLFELNRRYSEFIENLKRSGLIHLVALTHILLGLAMCGISFFFFRDYVIPVALGVVSHLMTDVHELL